jgi:putative tryptophan/tyrosine transport system substrate-binding protein
VRVARKFSPPYAEAAERAFAHESVVRSVILPYLATRGFVEGRNLVVDVRVGRKERMPQLAQAIVGYKADVIIAASDWALHAARAATNTIPIVAAPIGTDPVRAGRTRAATSRAFA